MTDDELRELLVWKPNGTLEPGKEAEVDTLLSRSSATRVGLRLLEAIRSSFKEGASKGLGELGFERLRRRIREESQDRASGSVLDKPSEAAGGRFEVPWRSLAVAASTVLVIQNG